MMNTGGEFTVTKEMVSVRIPREMNRVLTEYVRSIGITKNAFILSLLRREMERCVKRRG